MPDKPLFHGSDLEQIEAYYGIPKENIISFSSNVTPLGISPLLRKQLIADIDAVSTYPDRGYTALRRSIAKYCGTDPADLLIGNGATELISLLIQTLRPEKALLIHPTYSEYEREIQIWGGALNSFQLSWEDDFRLHTQQLFDVMDASYDLLILCNPNNPTGTALRRNTLRQILSVCRDRDITVMIDETYVEFTDDIDDITAVPLVSEYENLFVLRGVSKFFSAPGLRLGYGITGNVSLKERILSIKNPWTVHTLAALAGGSMFTDREYIRKTRDFISYERRRLTERLRRIPSLHVYEPSANFILMRILKENVTSADIFDAAIRQGLMLRDCSSFPGLGENHIRFCFARPEENDRLIGVVENFLNDH